MIINSSIPPKDGDPIFTALQMQLLMPCACYLLIKWRMLLTMQVLRCGFILGTCLASALLCLTWSLKSTGMTETTIFQSLNGLVATGIAVLIFRQRLSLMSGLACLCLILGIGLSLIASVSHWQGNIAAFVGGAGLTIFAFLVEHLLIPEIQHHPKRLWVILGVQCIAMAACSLINAIWLGEWTSLRTLELQDLFVLGYTSFGTILIPLIFTTNAQRYVNAVTVAYLAILEPIIVAACAFFMGERLPMLAYAGGGMVLAGIMLQAIAGAENPSPPRSKQSLQLTLQYQSTTARTITPPAIRPLLDMQKREHRPILGKRAAILILLLFQMPHGANLSTLQYWTGARRKRLYTQLSILQKQGYVTRLTASTRRYMLHPTILPPMISNR